MDTSDCLAIFAEAANVAKLAPDIAFYEVISISVTGNNCVFNFAGITDTICISNKRLAGLVQEVFNDCINDSKVAAGDCFVLEDTARVCLGNQKNVGFCVQVGLWRVRYDLHR